jgi:hypothetical protein
MLTITVSLWLFLALFMFREFEEAILIAAWKKRNAGTCQRFYYTRFVRYRADPHCTNGRE